MTTALAPVERGTEPGRPRGSKLAYMPALDGVRGVAVLIVMAYHAGVGWLPGGFLSLDIFFALSGYLITTLLVTEWQRRTTIGLGAFWAGRARRLLPALFLVVLFVVWFARAVALAGTYPELRSDALATLFYVANWHFISEGTNYFVQTGQVSPLTHTWSLAIEEQFYLVWPLVVLLVLKATRSLRVLLAICLGGMLASALEMAVLYRSGSPVTRLYYGTDTHAQSLFVGATLALALLVVGERRREIAPSARRPLATLGWVGVAALAALMAAGSYGAGWVWEGGLLAAALTTALILLCVVLLPDGVLARILSFSPLRGVGQISYGLYLWHFPIFQWLDGSRTGLVGASLLWARFGATFAIATVSFFVVERPIRRGALLRRWRGWIGAPAALGGVLAIVLLGTSVSEASTIVSVPPKPAVGTGKALTRVMLVGDSTAFTLGEGLSVSQGRYGAEIFNRGVLGCGIAIVSQIAGQGRVPAPCDASSPPDQQWPARWSTEIARIRPQIVAVLAGRWEVTDVEWDGRWTNILSARFAAYVEQQLKEVVRIGSARGAHVDLLTAPCYDSGEQPNGSPWPQDSAVRLHAYNDLVAAVAKSSGGRASLVNLDGMVCPGGVYHQTLDGVLIRSPDGIHFPWVPLTANGLLSDSSTNAQVNAFGYWIGRRLWPALLGQR